MATINAVVATKVATFPVGTSEGTFDFTLVDANGTAIQSISVAVAAATFTDVAPGTYTVAVSKNGYAATTSVTVPVPDVQFNVPDTIVATLS